MNTNAAPRSSVAIGPGDRALRWAWLSLLLYPLSFLAAFGIGEGLFTLLGGDTTTADPALWQLLAAAVPALAVFGVPGVLAWWQGRRAVRLGRRTGTVPAVIGVVVGVGFVLVNVAAYFTGG